MTLMYIFTVVIQAKWLSLIQLTNGILGEKSCILMFCFGLIPCLLEKKYVLRKLVPVRYFIFKMIMQKHIYIQIMLIL